MVINYTKHADIDKARWNNCIRNAVNGNIYAWSWYLDAVSENWDALISEDYQFLMPLTWRQKWGIKYLYRPLLSQQLGVFSTQPLDTETVLEFLKKIPKKYRLIEITLNKHNSILAPGFESSKHISCELDLISEHSIIESEYSQNTKRNLKKTEKNKLTYDPNVSDKDFLALMWEDSSAGSAILLNPSNQILLKALLKNMKDQKAGQTIGARDPEGQLIAAVLFGYSHDKWYYLAPVNSDQGREKRALFGIINHLIMKQSGQTNTLDFEGSDIPGLARFYKGFGAKNYYYSFIRRNKLPWPVKMFKS